MAKQLRRKYYARKVRALREGDPRNWWRNIKQITGLQSKSAEPLMALANQLHDGNTEELATSINQYFQQVAADLPSLNDDTLPPPPDFIPFEFTIGRAAVERKLSRINTHKAPGPDGLPNWVLRDFSTPLSGPVCAIFNASIREGFVPTCWKEANVIPVPKIQPLKSIQSDLRPISLTPTLGKLMESFVGSWILGRIVDKLDDHQYGALKRRSTTHALVDMMHHWHSAVDAGQSVRTVFIDFAKAFDHVDHNILVAKLLSLDLPDIIIRWMMSFLAHRQQRVKIGNVLSDWLEMSAGMPQGSFLGPLTFIILIDSLRASCLTHKFVDDTTMSEIISKGTSSSMQTIVDDIVQQASQDAMNVNGKKTKEMLVGPINKNPPPPLTLEGTVVDRVSTFKLLGVHVADDLKWQQHVDAIASKTASRLYYLKLLKRSGASVEDLLCFYATVVRPVLEYASPVWHTGLTVAQSDSLESLQKRALTIIFCNPDYATTLTLSGLPTLKSRREQLTFKFFRNNILNNNSCLHYLLPEQRNPDIIHKLRRAKQFEPLQTRTEKFKNSFLPYCLLNCQ